MHDLSLDMGCHLHQEARMVAWWEPDDLRGPVDVGPQFGLMIPVRFVLKIGQHHIFLIKVC